MFLKTLKIYPNPADEFISIQIDEFLNDDLNVEILDVSGKVAKTERMKENTQYLKIDSQNFTQGVYFIRLTGGKKVRMAKIFIAKK